MRTLTRSLSTTVRIGAAALVLGVAAFAAAPAQADGWKHGRGNGHWKHYRGGQGYVYVQPRYYYPPPPRIYYPPPPPVYYAPPPVYYGPPSVSLGFVFPIR